MRDRRVTRGESSTAHVWVCLAFLGCSGGGVRDATSATRGASERVSLAPKSLSSAGAGTESCATKQDGAHPSLERIPQFVSAFRHASPACSPLRSQHLLRNTGTTVLGVEGIRVWPALFTLETEKLPRELRPGQTLAVSVGYVGESQEARTGKFVVQTSEGCREFSLTGVTAYDTLLTQSDLAMDFGPVEAGQKSAIREVLQQVEFAKGAPRVRLGGFATGGPFELVEGPTSDVVPASCERVSLRVQASAPMEPGWVEGSLSWTSTTLAPDSPEGIASIRLFVTAVNDANRPQ